MRQKNNIRIVRQGVNQGIDDFARLLEKECDEWVKHLKAQSPPICVMTADEKGTLTATIQIITHVEDSDEAAFDGFRLRSVYEKFKELGTDKASAYQDYLLKLKAKDI